MRYNGIYVSAEKNQAITGADVLIELQVPAGTQIEIIRMWCSAADNLIDDVQEIEIYHNDTAGSGGIGLSEFSLQGTADASTTVTALGGPTIGTSPLVFYPDSFHLQNGWLYLPVPEERIRVVGAGNPDNVGFRFHVAPGASVTVSYGVVWGETS